VAQALLGKWHRLPENYRQIWVSWNRYRQRTQELRSVLQSEGTAPFTLIGFSWGAWLGYILAAAYPFLVKKLILIGSGPFEEKYSQLVMETRLNRLGGEEKKEVLFLLAELNSRTLNSDLFARIGKLMSKAYSYDPMTYDIEVLPSNPGIYQSVWEQASRLRSNGELLELGTRIQCAVVAIHGDYDPHPAEGVRAPLSRVLKDFRFILLEKCGHCPWLERNARDDFYRVLRREIRNRDHERTGPSA
jgi:pimeloyl-ACP methyl ester carboxylesterase